MNGKDEQESEETSAQLADPWDEFNRIASEKPPLGTNSSSSPLKIALYFPRPEIVPNVRAGVYRYSYYPNTQKFSVAGEGWSLPEDDCRAIIESQLLSLRLRSSGVVEAQSSEQGRLPAQPRRIYLVGGGSSNPAIAKLAGEILGSVEGVYKLDVGGNACALGSAYKAVWACERKEGETFEDLIGARWDEGKFATQIATGYQEGLYQHYGRGVEALRALEQLVVQSQAVNVSSLGTTGAEQI